MVTAGVLWLPFIPANGPLNYLANLREYQDGVFSVLSLRAWNPWWIVQVLGRRWRLRGRTAPPSWAPVTFRQLGFAFAGVLALVVFIGVYRRPSPQGLALGLAAITLVAFTALTTMHERYAYPAFVFLLMAANGRVLAVAWVAFAVAFLAEPGVRGAGARAVAARRHGDQRRGRGGHHADDGRGAALDGSDGAPRLRRRGAAAALAMADGAMTEPVAPKPAPPAAGGWWTRAFGIVLILAAITWMVTGFGMTFFSDEWAFISERSLADPSDWLRPHNEHWSTLPIILYRLLVETIGIGSYVPYHAVLVLVHLGVAAMVFRLVRRRSGPAWAFAAGVLVAFFGSGFENVFWAFQIGFVGSVLLGLLAADITDGEATGRRAIAVAALLLLSLTTSGIGVAMSVVVGVMWLLDRRWWRSLPSLAVPALVFAAWQVAFGAMGVETHRNPFTLAAAADVVPFMLQGLGDAVAAVGGLGGPLGTTVGLLVFAWAAIRLARGSLPPLAGGALAAIVVQYVLTGLVRGGDEIGVVHYSRYSYISGILMMLAISSLAGRPRWPERSTLRLAAVATLAGVGALTVFYNLSLLAGGREIFLHHADQTRALLVAGLRRPLPAETDPDRTLVLVPSPDEVDRIVATYGDARMDTLVSFAVRPVPEEMQDFADRLVREGVPVPPPEW